jgi:Na+/proline symporter
VATLIFVPRIRRLSVARNYNSPNDLVSDRFNNRLLTVFTSLTVCIPQLMYVIAQFYTLKNLIPVLSLGQMNAEVTVWFFAAVIYVCETLGGFDAVSLTDSLQSTLMIISLIL